MRIIPAIDIFEGKCVRLREGNFSARKVYADDPLESAKRFVDAGARWLHVVDLEGAKEGRVVNWPQLEAISGLEGPAVQVGGGVRTFEEASRLLAAGARRIVAGSLAIRSPSVFERWVRHFGPEKFCAAVDVSDGLLLSNGWRSREEATVDEVVSRIESIGLNAFLCTDVARDGTLSGPNIKLYETLVSRFPRLEWIASGGVSSTGDLRALEKTNVTAVVVGKAFYEGAIGLKELVEFKC